MTASGDPAVCIKFPISGDSPRACASCEALCECAPDMEEIAESIEDVRGTPRAIAARCSGRAAI